MSEGLKKEETKGTGQGAFPKPPPSPWESPSVFPRDVHDKIVEIHQKINTMPLPLPVPDWPETSTSKTEVQWSTDLVNKLVTAKFSTKSKFSTKLSFCRAKEPQIGR